MFGILVTILLLMIWMLSFYLLKKNMISILVGVGIGICGVFVLAGLVESSWFMMTGISLTEMQSKTIVAPIVEESSKLLFIFLGAWFFYRRGVPLRIVLFGASAGLGFAFIENFGVAEQPLNALYRGGPSWTMHVLTATLLSMGVDRLVKVRSRANTFWVLLVFLIAVGAHAAYNWTILYLGFH